MKLLLILPLLLITILPAFAQEPITLNVDRTADTIIISGTVYPIIHEAFVTIQIMEKGNLIDISQVEIIEDGTYSHMLLVDSDSWKQRTNFIVKSSYQDDTIKVPFNIGPTQLTSTPEIVKNGIVPNDGIIIKDLKKEIVELKLYNRVLKQTITSLYVEIDTLNFIIETLDSLCNWVTWEEQI